MRDILEDVRDACRTVSEGATHVRIEAPRLRGYAATFPIAEVTSPADDPGRQPLGDDEATASFVIALDAINFGSGYFPYIRKRPGMSGYFTIAASLREYVQRNGPLTSARLRTLTGSDCATIFGQQHQGELADELMAHFATALNDLGSLLDADHYGSFGALVRSAGGSAARLVGILDQMPFFHDVATWRDLRVPLYKRAQITAFDLAQAFGGHGLGRFDDLDRLTMFADNLVPHVLRVDGVLVFDDDLCARIAREDDIPAGSEPEIEIRAVALHAVELLGDHLRAAGHEVTSAQLDSALWTRGGRPEYKAVPRHRTRTVYY
ncbi:MAG TPA: queuosine salvage family protein [Acidimicrobiales bacterium]|jgi:hypothetical protein|nr:queuosine salvage family protein [Acidimicrobiales bacterium]